jgi:hypothetical protein
MKFIIAFGVMLSFVAVSVAQNSDLNRSVLNTAAYYNYSDPGDVTIQVHVWGAMRYPGFYEIPRDTKLSELVSLAGGPTVPERTRRSVRNVQFQLYRKNGLQREVILNIQMENEIVVSESDPVLQAGDVLAVQSVVKQTFGIRDLFPIISATFTLALLLERLTNK